MIDTIIIDIAHCTYVTDPIQKVGCGVCVCVCVTLCVCVYVYVCLCVCWDWSNLFSLVFLSRKLSLCIFFLKERYVSISISPPSLSLIGSLTTEIYYQTEKIENTDKHTDTV